MMNILLPTDFSENAFEAACYGLHLLQGETCVFYVMHTYTPPIYRVDYVMGSPGQLGLPDDHQYFAETNLRGFVDRLGKEFKNTKHTFIPHSAFNTLADETVRMVKNENIDLIIMGTQGATGAKELFFGSNALHIIKKATTPVLVIPSNTQFTPPNVILFPTDLEIDFKQAQLNVLFGLSQLWNAKIHILHLTAPEGLDEVQFHNRKKLKELLQYTSFVYHDLPDQELLVAIDHFHKEHKMDILAMVQNKHTFLERLFIMPIIKNIGLHSLVPFLVLPYMDKPD
ncbi:universal stress protein [Muricauda sp. SCSIO 64092]|uniref:universal stress protein n=1 Tax=Allomuricauda sp. SCSIO 64092 TaxID=2908842 RepID=UPI001FF54346|nr:universal stress protein [Muricauda sp. SCSIO 64092]UOY09001.1 universal stress protein [Muricauda sp. SCSIO 64092]